MRTDCSTDGTNSPSDAAPVSRRAFLVASGLVAGTGVSGVVGATDRRRDQPVEVEATAPYLSAARELVRAYERSEDVRVRLRPMERSSAEAFLDSTADVQFAGRPATPRERDATSESLVHDVGIRGWAALKHPDGEWRECLRRDEIRDQWASDAPVETWAESRWHLVPDHGGGDSSAAVNPPDRRSDSAVFVRGTRPYQYSQGFGGVGYYRVERETLDRPARRADSTPVVRLEYVNVDPAVRGHAAVESLLEFYDRRTASATVDGAQFLDPAVEGAV